MARFVPLRFVQITDAFWREKQRLVRRVVLPYQWDTLNDRVPDAAPSHCIHNFQVAAGEKQGAFGGAIFQDTDLYKWLEAVAYCLAQERDAGLETLSDGAIDLIARAQRPDGYLDTYYTIAEPEGRWSNLMEGHELYCAGHYIEAAVAYAEATGKRKSVEIAVRLADCIGRAFGEGGLDGYAGHPEIELALVRLYRYTQNEDYLRLARHFIDVRGAGKEDWFEIEKRREGHRFVWTEMEHFGSDYFLSDKPVREQTVAGGHAVRAVYLYSAMADLALLDRDEGLRKACETLFQNVSQRRMYVTGGIGSASLGERFTADFDLPNDSVYSETCASVGLMMFAKRMFLLTGDLAAYDVWERALTNTVLAGLGRDGKHFFYVNPLEVNPRVAHANPTLEHVKTVRQKWFGVACCPPNIARTLSSLGESLYALEEGRLLVMAHIASRFRFEGAACELSRNGDEFTLTLDAPPTEVVLRVPEGFEIEGDARFMHAGGKAAYRYRLVPRIRLLRADPRVSADAGKLCVMRGETVYCAEERDNGADLCALDLDASKPVETFQMDFLPEGMPALRASGWRRLPSGELYSACPPKYEPATIVLVPYSEWNNRGEGEMRVWMNERTTGDFISGTP